MLPSAYLPCVVSVSVHTFPCLRAFLDSTEVKTIALLSHCLVRRSLPSLPLQLFRPKDDKLDEFWIDFNFGSRCVSFFIDEPQVVLQYCTEYCSTTQY